jgi:hypothetical protein
LSLFGAVTKYLRKTQEDRFVLAHGFRFQSMVRWFHCSGPVVSWSIMVERVVVEDIVEQSCWTPGNQGAKRQSGGDQGQGMPFKDMAPVTYFFQPGP